MRRSRVLCVGGALVVGLAGCGADEAIGPRGADGGVQLGDGSLSKRDGPEDSHFQPDADVDAADANADARANDAADAGDTGGGGLFEPLSRLTLEGEGPVLAISVRGDLAVLGRALSAGPELVVVRLEPPGSAAMLGAMDVAGSVRAAVLEGNRAYLATSGDARELLIVDLSDSAAPSISSAFDAPGDADGTALDAVGNRVVLGRAGGSHAEVLFIDATDPTAPVLVGSAHVEGDVTDIEIHQSVAYVATTNPTAALVGLDYSDLSAVSTAWSRELPGPARALDLNESRLYVVGAGAGQGYYVELEAPADVAPYTLSSLLLEGDPSDVVAYGAYVMIAAGADGLLAFDRVRPPALKKPAISERLKPAFGAQTLAFDDHVMLVGAATSGAVEFVRAGVVPRIEGLPPGGLRVLSVLGDSNSARPDERTWVHDLFGLLVAPHWLLVNRAAPYGVLVRSDAFSDAWEQLEITVGSDAPNAVVLAFGTNDISFAMALADAFGTVPGEPQMVGIVNELVALRKRCEEQRLMAFIALTPACFTDALRTQLTFELNHQLRNTFDPAMLIDFHSTMGPEDYLDAIHVGPTGSAERALEAWRKFEPEYTLPNSSAARP